MIGKRQTKQKRKPVLYSTTPVSIESNWACLPEDLLVSILDRMVILSDYVRFSAVCMPWHAVALAKYHGKRRHKLSLHQPPLLFLTHIRPRASKGKTTTHIYNVSQNNTYKLKSFVPNHSHKWCGSSHGWLISVDNNLAITLSHPFCSNLNGGDGIIHLPRVQLVSHRNYYIVKVILSADPIVAPDDYTVMVIYNPYGELGFIRPRDKAWTRIKGSENFVDVIYSKGLFYALDKFGSVNTCDINSDHCRPKLNKVSPTLSHDEGDMTYIVESAGGDLLQLLRTFVVNAVFYDDNKQRIVSVVTKGFEVFKLLVVNKEQKWIQTKNLGDGALFLGDNSTSTYVSASDFLGCQPNSIYFTEYCQPCSTYFAHHDMGIFNLGDKSIQRDCVSKFLSSKKKTRPPVFSVSPPCWIEPAFKGKKA